ncbi:hypothetical protein F3K50_16550 [Pseudomonas marginalis]|nr:hypothetical protein F3K50_16550 [Pseudomonas marginalis]
MGSVAVLHIYLGYGRYGLLDPYNKANNNLKSLGIIGTIGKVFRDAEGMVFSSMVKEAQEPGWDNSLQVGFKVINREGEIVSWEVFKNNNSHDIQVYISDLMVGKEGISWGDGKIALLMNCPDNIDSGAYFVDGTFYANRDDFVKWRDSFVGIS